MAKTLDGGRISSFALLMGTSALVITLSSGAAMAANCTAVVPPPPPPAPGAKNVTNTTPNAVVLNNSGASGCTGVFPFINGGVGQAAGASEQTTALVPGKPVADSVRSAPAGAVANGGAGGQGSGVQYIGNDPFPSLITSGRGGGGGAGAAAKLDFEGLIDKASAAPSLLVTGNGGNGGDGGRALTKGTGDTTAGDGGRGGDAGSATLRARLGIGKAIPADAIAVQVEANGGKGGSGGRADCCATARGGNGFGGGNAGVVSVDLDGIRATPGSSDPSLIQGSIIATARGGNGGAGGTADGTKNHPGNGGNGGVGGKIDVNLGALSRIVASSRTGDTPAGVLVHSNGGEGGAGGDVAQSIGTGGGPGLAGDGGNVSLSINGLVQTTGVHMHGAVVQSVGGGGGSGGFSQNFFGGRGVAGQNGGDGGSVTIKTDEGLVGPNGRINVFGRSSTGLIAQSVGGGGGAAGDVTAVAPGFAGAVAVGGKGGAGGTGGPVTVSLGESFITSRSPAGEPTTETDEFGGGGVLAQSIAGKGGAAGSVAVYGVGLITVAVGSTGGAGGAAGPVTVTNNDTLITTYGDHGVGIDAQSIGGGGGKGGTAFSLDASKIFSASVSIGGNGGSGGVGGKATINNKSQIITYGPDAAGLKAKSIGGGGGHGGAAVATAATLTTLPEIPGVSASVVVGGKGGTGNVSDVASVTNSGFVATGGHGAPAIVSHSIAGGGGMGGDSSASAFTGGTADFQVSVSVSVGGDGGSGAQAKEAYVDNSGLLATFGNNAAAIHAQSVGGGGGIAGSAENRAQIGDQGKYGLTTSVSVGGKGASGGLGNFVNVTNTGGIGTSGDGSAGIFAQSIGGGGGFGGASDSTADGGNLAYSVAIGGDGGRGNTSGAVLVTNTNTIVTAGVDSAGIFAQSIGGGGGKGGKGGATAGGAVKAPQLALGNSLTNGLNNGEKTEEVEPGVIKVGTVTFDVDNIDPSQITEMLEKIEKAEDGDIPAPQIKFAIGVGGSGGSAGDGNTVEINNSGQISTALAMSDGITAQSIGGGGGHGGGSSSTISNDVDITLELGGVNASSGKGGRVAVTTTANSHIQTEGVAAAGILAQSIGGGGGTIRLSGEGADAGGGDSVLEGAKITIGGESRNFDTNDPGGTSGNGGPVQVNIDGGSIGTGGKHGIGIIAQSIGGGGGLSHFVTNADIDPRTVNNDAADAFSIDPKFGGLKNGGGGGDAIDITIASANAPNGVAIATTGRGAHGILAQSFGGFGGAAIGGLVNATEDSTGVDYYVVNSFTAGGNGGPIAIAVNNSMTTDGQGAYGILAQSIGGGGSLAGDFDKRQYDPKLVPFSNGRDLGAYRGNGGKVDVRLNTGTIQTNGASAEAIFVQSLGGGGGHIGTDFGILSGTYGGNGRGGSITIDIAPVRGVPVTFGAPNVIATGSDSDGISAQSDGGLGGSPITVNIGPRSLVQGGLGNGSAIRLRGGSLQAGEPNVINNAGTIRPFMSVSDGIGLWVDRATTFTNAGTFIGDICGPGQVTGGPTPGCGPDAAEAAGASDRAVTVNNQAAGLIAAGNVLDLGVAGVLNNEGTVRVGRANEMSTSRLWGDLNHAPSGRLVFDLDAENDAVDRLDIDGTAELAGAVTLNPVTLLKTKQTVMSATEGVARRAGFTAEQPHVFTYTPAVEGSDVTITTDADFRGADGAHGDTRESLAGHLQDIWDTGEPGFGTGFAALAGVQQAGEYTSALDRLSGEAVSSVATARTDASLRLVQNAFSCPVFVDETSLLGQRSCAWTRVEGAAFDKNATDTAVDYDGTAFITMLGGQYEIVPDWFLGGVVGYEISQLSSDEAATNVDGKAGLAVVALKRQKGPLLLAGAVDFGYGWYDSSRRIDVADTRLRAQSSNNSFNTGLNFRAAYQLVEEQWYLQPSVDFSLNYIKLDGYEESGAGPFNLDVDNSDGTTFAVTPALELGRRLDLEGGAVLRAFASAGVSMISGSDWKTNARFAAAPEGTSSFTSTVDAPDILGRFSAGVDVFDTGPVSVQAKYDADVGANYLSQSASLRLTLLF